MALVLAALGLADLRERLDELATSLLASIRRGEMM